MHIYIALLRAVNVGGTGKLPMSDLKSMCEAAGFRKVTTYIASGNVVFVSPYDSTETGERLEAALHEYAGKAVGVFVRSPAQLQELLRKNPYHDKAANQTVAIFLDQAPTSAMLDAAKGRDDELLALGQQEIYAHYPSGQGKSKLLIPAAKTGTARNFNTIAKLLEIAEKL